jgi:hypothetical protein
LVSKLQFWLKSDESNRQFILMTTHVSARIASVIRYLSEQKKFREKKRTENAAHTLRAIHFSVRVTVLKIMKQESVKAATLCSVHVFPTFLLLELLENNNELDALTDLRLEVRVYMHHMRLVHLKTNIYISLYRLICRFLLKKKKIEKTY